MTPPTFPARPTNGGELERARPKRGDWSYEPKFNGWRALVHAPTGQMWNRHGKRLTIEPCFQKVLDRLRLLDVVWLDCEAMERRLDAGRGSLIVFDSPSIKGAFLERRSALHLALDGAVPWALHKAPAIPDNEIIIIPPTTLSPATLYGFLQEENERLKQPLYEGVVAKRNDSLYPTQLRSPDEKTAAWIKHRWCY